MKESEWVRKTDVTNLLMNALVIVSDERDREYNNRIEEVIFKVVRDLKTLADE